MSDEIMISFPPDLSVKEFLVNRIEYKQPLNSYMIYRKVYTRTLKSKGIKLPLSDVSKLSSKSWGNEPPEVKEWYKNFSAQVREKHRRTHWRYKNVNPGRTQDNMHRNTLTFVFENPGPEMNAIPNKIMDIMNLNDSNDVMCPLVSQFDMFNVNSPT
ncbi:19717_t:CDS:2 [Cetraspora pellucida]|uniref:19717_t:CDS:1 n=1 Tax=Cetraspora pellucida TaxID=1433469 RepID=A0A9N9FUI2_9GLOM|nr:19717_t:CDS:2 [Cetraspora pellucida]